MLPEKDSDGLPQLVAANMSFGREGRSQIEAETQKQASHRDKHDGLKKEQVLLGICKAETKSLSSVAAAAP